MTTYITQPDKNGKTVYYRVTDGKKSKVSRAAYEAAQPAEPTTLKQNRWVKVHEPGQANYDGKENVIDISIGESHCKAEVTYSTDAVPNYKKAAYWIFRSLGVVGATQIVSQAAEQVKAAVENIDREAPEVIEAGEGWRCEIEKLAQKVFRVCLTWTPAGPVIKKGSKMMAAA